MEPRVRLEVAEGRRHNDKEVSVVSGVVFGPLFVEFSSESDGGGGVSPAPDPSPSPCVCAAIESRLARRAPGG